MGSLRITALVIVLYNALFLFSLLQSSRQKYGSLQRAKAELEYAALQNQVNPHFLFNSLNTLQSLIHESPKLAAEFVDKLSLCYRYILDNKGKELISVSHELAFGKSFVHLLKVRFGDALEVIWPKQEPDIYHKLPPLSLQILLENAVKHNIVSRSKPLHITVEYTDSGLSIANNLQLRQDKPQSTGTGLENIAKRYALLTDQSPEISQDEKQFKVKLPVLVVRED